MIINHEEAVLGALLAGREGYLDPHLVRAVASVPDQPGVQPSWHADREHVPFPALGDVTEGVLEHPEPHQGQVATLFGAEAVLN